ncbi:MAG: 2-hydroxychromene-2-carboxylate isomerase [Proteobacteria bacterium]|nr:2-hydroxychromene-2-carboxylate isomerase [Pseudomonadota bacterium]
MSNVEYFYAAHSAYAYLGSAKFMQIMASAGRDITHKPVDLIRVMQGYGSTAFRDRSVKHRNHFFNREMERWAEFRDVVMPGRPANHHHSPDLANRMLIAALSQGQNVDRLAHRMLEAHWAESADLADPSSLMQIAGDVGLDGKGWLDLADSPAIAAQYAANTDEAIARGVLGSPTYFVEGDMFYGQDRLDLVERALQKPFRNTWPPITQ